MSSTKDLLEKVYSKPIESPWYTTEPPEEIIGLIDKKMLKPCKVLEIGCGTGTIAIYLARKGFEVTAIDLSEKAIEFAKKEAKQEKVNISFKVVDALNLNLIKDRFDWIIEWGVLHYIEFSKRKEYVKSLSELLNKNGLYVSLSFNEESPYWGSEKVRVGASGAQLYFSSLEELRELFSKYFNIIEGRKRKTYFENLKSLHIHNYFLMKKM